MNRCENYQTELSALLDGESDAATAVTALDHVAGCRTCRDFWTRLRAVQAAVDALPAGVTLPAGAVRERTDGSGSRRRLGFGAVAWVWPAAALLLLAIGLSTLPRDDSREARLAGSTRGNELSIRLGADPAGMDRERFFALATELLEANGIYRAEMDRVLAAVDDAAPPPTELPLEAGAELELAGDPAAPERRQHESDHDRRAPPLAIPN
jgi:hypothetical protein